MEEGELRAALEENYDAVFRFLLKMSGDEEKARDLCQETMVKAILASGRFRGASTFRTWLISIAANACRDDRRKRKPLSLETGISVEPEDGREGAEEADRRLEASRAWDLLAELPIKKRQALVLRFELDCSYEEIASVLHCPVGTVRSRIHGAIDELRLKMAMGGKHEA